MKKNKDIAIGISTFLRDESLFKLLKSLAKYCPEFKIYLIDQGKSDNFKRTFYKGLIQQGHVVKFIPFDSGISRSRYILKNLCKEKYLVYMQDDFEAIANTNLYKLYEILEENKHIGIVGGNTHIHNTIETSSYFLNYIDNKICYFPVDYLLDKKLISWKTTSNNIKFIEANIISDFTMWRKEIPNIFDENVKTIEHTHIYLLVKYKTKFSVAYCPEVEIRHLHDKSNMEYNNFRSRKKDLEYIKKYWNVEDFHKFDKRSLHLLEQTNIIDCIETEKIKIENKIDVAKENSINKTIINTNGKTYDTIEVFSKLLNNNVPFVLIRNSCLCAVMKKEINNIQIAIPDLTYIEKINHVFPNHNFLLEITSFKNKKNIMYKNLNLEIPCPVVKYLENTFKLSFDELTKNQNV